jgi:hypothetical protein
VEDGLEFFVVAKRVAQPEEVPEEPDSHPEQRVVDGGEFVAGAGSLGVLA